MQNGEQVGEGRLNCSGNKGQAVAQSCKCTLHYFDKCNFPQHPFTHSNTDIQVLEAAIDWTSRVSVSGVKPLSKSTHSLACALRHTPYTLPCTFRHVWVYTHNPLHVRCPRTIFQNTTTWDLKTLLSSSPNSGEAYCRARQRELHRQGGVPRTHRAHVRDMAERLRSGAHQALLRQYICK